MAIPLDTTAMSVQTKGGTLEVRRSPDPDYPGFALLLDGEQVGMLEYDSVRNAVQIHIWKRGSEDPDFATVL